jgi:hypothetical protein
MVASSDHHGFKVPNGLSAHGVPRDHVFPPARWVQERWRRNQNLNVLDVENS